MQHQDNPQLQLTARLRAFGARLAQSASCQVYHYRRPDKREPPYIVWAEIGEEDAEPADNIKCEQSISGQVLYYTRTEYDLQTDVIQDVLQTVCGARWALDDVSFDAETSTICYSWRFSIG